jgi:HK97 family phage portal protein
MSFLSNLKGKFLSNKINQELNKKSFNYGCGMSFVDYLFSIGSQNISFYQCIRYYQQCAPLFTAIQMIADEVADIRPYLYSPSKLEFIKKDPLLDLIYNPNADCTGAEFMEQLAAYFLIAGNAYIMATGAVNRAPLELWIIPPQYVTLTAGSDGYTEVIQVNPNTNFAYTFTRKEVDGRFRFYSGDDKEIWHIKEFNPLMSSNNLYGMPKLMPIWYEIEQYINSSAHNLSLLKRGARVSGALVSEVKLDDDEFMRLNEQVDRFYSGSPNAGRVMVLESGMEFREMSVNNKDMDFLELKKNVTNTIYTALKIPLSLINQESSTYNNMGNSQLMLYDNAVLPLVKRLYQELTNFLIPRYPNLRELELAYSPDEITALEPRRTEDLKKLKESAVLTVNELRAKIGYEPVEGGDSLFGSLSEGPIAQDTYTEDEPKQPYPKSIKEEFIEVMKAQRYPDNSRKYSDAYIEEIARKYDI